MSEPEQAIDDPSLAALVELSERRFTGLSELGDTEADVNGAMDVVAVRDLRGESDPARLGARLVEALNDARAKAMRAVEEFARTDPKIAPQLKALVDGEQLPVDGEVSAADLDRTFEGTSDDQMVIVRVEGRTQRFTSVYLDRVTPDVLAAVPQAANRAMAAAQTGRDGATPLSEEMDARLEQLDQAMDKIEERLGGIEDELDAILRGLG
ncbi:MAG: YbaB/EbfC family nucleoid-associated protein [Propionibacteriaceae bacterium]|nr:YbaB/EbfC family nucleoid-associated protein [Propionibacteriaceae bacterium]